LWKRQKWKKLSELVLALTIHWRAPMIVIDRVVSATSLLCFVLMFA
jgi:hypothetical protein